MYVFFYTLIKKLSLTTSRTQFFAFQDVFCFKLLKITPYSVFLKPLYFASNCTLTHKVVSRCKIRAREGVRFNDVAGGGVMVAELFSKCAILFNGAAVFIEYDNDVTVNSSSHGKSCSRTVTYYYLLFATALHMESITYHSNSSRFLLFLFSVSVFFFN